MIRLEEALTHVDELLGGMEAEQCARDQ